MVVTMKNGAWYPVGDDRETTVRALYKIGRKEIDLFGDGEVIVTHSGIDQILSDRQFEMVERRKAGDWTCREGQWHTRAERYCGGHQPAEKPIDLSYLRDGSEPKSASPNAKRWGELIQANSLHAKRTGKFGGLKTLEDLDEFQKTGVMPEREEVPKSMGVRRVMKKTTGAFPGTEKWIEVEVPVD